MNEHTRALLAEIGIAHHVLWQPHTLTWAMPRKLLSLMILSVPWL